MTTNATPPPVPSPRPSIWHRLWPYVIGLFGVILVAASCYYFGSGLLPVPKEGVVVRFANLYGIKPGCDVELRDGGGRVGEVEAVEQDTATPDRPWKVTLQIDPAYAPEVSRKATRFSISRLDHYRLKIIAPNRFINKPAVIAWPGDADAPECREFTGMDAQPQLHDLGPSVTVRWADVHQVMLGTPVTDNAGRKIGEVVEIGLADGDGTAAVQIILKRNDAPARLACREGALWAIKRLRINRLVIAGEEQVIDGPSIVVLPGLEDAKGRYDFVGSAAPPLDPRVRPDSPRKEIGFGQDVHGIDLGSYAFHLGWPIGQVANVYHDQGARQVVVDVVSSTRRPPGSFKTTACGGTSITRTRPTCAKGSRATSRPRCWGRGCSP